MKLLTMQEIKKLDLAKKHTYWDYLTDLMHEDEENYTTICNQIGQLNYFFINNKF